VSVVPILGFVLLAVLAVGFAVLPLLRRSKDAPEKSGEDRPGERSEAVRPADQSKKARLLLLGAIALALLGIATGTYLLVGRPHLAQRAAQGLKTREINGLVPYLIERARSNPKDPRVWQYLAQAYMSAGDAGDAAKALVRAIQLQGKGNAGLDAAYGEALVMQSGGTVPDQAEAAFKAALAADRHNVPARFYLGMARLQRRDSAGAVAMWQSLLADVPTTAPLHQMLVDRIAILTAQGLSKGSGAMRGGGAPDPRAMVAMLAARLKADPHDALGWVRLIRAYTVLGETDKAKEALVTARATFKDNKDALTSFSTAARALKLE
jgi:cytochrome c-type biogenesis protein CcmH